MTCMNMSLEVGLSCPACGADDRCLEDCICPSCWLPSRVSEDQRDLSVAQWVALSPVMHALNETSLSWGWATEIRQGKPRHSIEVTDIKDGTIGEITIWNGEYHASCWYHPYGKPESQPLGDFSAPTVDEIVSLVERTLDREPW